MDIRKPKPIHSLRELLTEIGVIVIGVAIALAGEQAVEWLHWQGEVKTARAAIQAEMGDNNKRFFSTRIAIESCFDRQLDEADAILTALEEKRAPGKFTNFRPGFGGLLVDSEWEAQRASQVLTHIPHGELAVMGSYYTMIPTFVGWMDQETAAWLDLSALRKPPTGSAVSDLLRLRARLDTARLMEARIVQNGLRQLEFSRQIGVPEQDADPASVRLFCTENIEDTLRRQREQRRSAGSHDRGSPK